MLQDQGFVQWWSLGEIEQRKFVTRILKSWEFTETRTLYTGLTLSFVRSGENTLRETMGSILDGCDSEVPLYLDQTQENKQGETCIYVNWNLWGTYNEERFRWWSLYGVWSLRHADPTIPPKVLGNRSFDRLFPDINKWHEITRSEFILNQNKPST